MGMALVHKPAGPKTEMTDDNSALYNTGQSLEAVVQLARVKNLFSRLFKESMVFAEIADTPSVHVLFGPNCKNRQKFRS
jgi:hypothetical protein